MDIRLFRGPEEEAASRAELVGGRAFDSFSAPIFVVARHGPFLLRVSKLGAAVQRILVEHVPRAAPPLLRGENKEGTWGTNPWHAGRIVAQRPKDAAAGLRCQPRLLTWQATVRPSQIKWR